MDILFFISKHSSIRDKLQKMSQNPHLTFPVDAHIQAARPASRSILDPFRQPRHDRIDRIVVNVDGVAGQGR